MGVVHDQRGPAPLELLKAQIDTIRLELGVAPQWGQFTQVTNDSTSRQVKNGEWDFHPHQAARPHVRDESVERLHCARRLWRRRPEYGAPPLPDLAERLLASETTVFALDFPVADGVDIRCSVTCCRTKRMRPAKRPRPSPAATISATAML